MTANDGATGAGGVARQDGVAGQEGAPPRTAGPAPNPGVTAAYAVPVPAPPIDLWLAGNEGRPPASFAVTVRGGELGRYPSAAGLEARVAERFGLDPEGVLVTAGADDGLLRLALAYLAEEREIVLPSPTFVMIPRYARLAGGTIVDVEWPAGSPYPTDAVIAGVTPRTSLIAVVSPNNPTGAVATPNDVARIAAAAPHALVVVDCAYAEFADVDLAEAALRLPNTVVLRTLSKAYGCAGLRVGFALGQRSVIANLRAAGNPYPCAAPSLAAAGERIDADIAHFVRRVRKERTELTALLRDLGVAAHTSQGNFVFAHDARAAALAELLAGFGIAVRAFPPDVASGADASLRITCPGSVEGFERLAAALRTALDPDTVLFDMDGVLADVSSSYRLAIVQTAASFGVEVTSAEIDAAKALGGANDDWSLTQRLVAQGGVAANLDEVTRRFEALYQGDDARPGLRETETLAIEPRALRRLAEHFRLGVVTGRPRSDAARFLADHGIAELFPVVVTRDDAPLKPDPEPTRVALERLGGERAWLVGDTRDDLESARGAGALGIGVVPPGTDPERAGAVREGLLRAGAGAVLARPNDLIELLDRVTGKVTS